MATITIIQTGTPSRSKMTGPCWVRVGTKHDEATYAAAAPREIEATPGSTITVQARVDLRRKTRSEREDRTWTLQVTGDPADTVTVSLGSPQSIDATLTGVKLA